MNATIKKFVSMLASLQLKLPANAVENFDDELAQRIYDDQQAGQEFMRFLQNGARVQVADFFRSTGELTLQLPALPRPTIEMLRGKYSWIKSIESDNSPIEATMLELGTVLRQDEKSSINGAEYEYRLGVSSYFGFQHACWLVDHQDEPELAAFKALREKVYVDFPGLKVVYSDGYRFVPCLNSDGRRWYVDFYWLGYDFSDYGRVAHSCK